MPALTQVTEAEGEGVGLDAWHMDYLYTLVTEQLDSIVSPNRQSSHMHRVLGGSNFAAAYNFDELRNSSCTSASISIDRFRMLAGEPDRKSANPIFVYECRRNPDLSGSISGPSFNFDDSCKYGIKFDLTFPSCWDGVNLYKTDGGHVAYPLNSIRDGGCPATHPKRLPSILLEYTYHPEAYPAVTKGQNMNGHLAWANGDTTSYGLHADFLNGWDVDILGKALNDPGCVNLGHSIEIQKCPTLAPYFDIAAGQACKPSRGQLTEPFPQGDGNVIPKLPGCNPLWGATGSKPTCNLSPAPLDVSAFQSTDGPYVLPASQQINSTLQLDQSKGWHSVACFDTTNSKPLGNTTLNYYDANMTPARCQSSCAKNGYSFAGLGILGGFNCICSNTLNNHHSRRTASVAAGNDVNNALFVLPARWNSGERWKERVKDGLQNVLNAMIAKLRTHSTSTSTSILAKMFQQYLIDMLEEERDNVRKGYESIYDAHVPPADYIFKFSYDSPDLPDTWIQIRAYLCRDRTFHFSFFAGYMPSSEENVFYQSTRHFTDAEAKEVETRAKEVETHAKEVSKAREPPVASEWDFCSAPSEGAKTDSDTGSVGELVGGSDGWTWQSV
ncbi:hypothetical protein QFC20_005007 [Naganishia adeliensis]|uniref:Uncharacterized protein n=1 Tax=Naganishia adeliensis TaxID=92952 RepID=A0ACC2VTI6_9TREE|nr:hypothetical protein QFC20_005007 [Naganishia adeliensis]